jgi:hypothetical protein
MRLQRTVVGGSQILNSNKTSKILDLYKTKKKKKKGKETKRNPPVLFFIHLFFTSSSSLFFINNKEKKGVGFFESESVTQKNGEIKANIRGNQAKEGGREQEKDGRAQPHKAFSKSPF